MIEINHIDFEKELLKSISVHSPEHLIDKGSGDLFRNTVDFIIKKYNSAISSGKNVQAAFEAVKELAKRKSVKYYSVFGDIGRKLENNELPSMLEVKGASEYCKLLDY